MLEKLRFGSISTLAVTLSVVLILVSSLVVDGAVVSFSSESLLSTSIEVSSLVTLGYIPGTPAPNLSRRKKPKPSLLMR